MIKLAKGDKVLTSTHNNAVTALNAARAKWGLSSVSGNVSTGSTANASQLNNLITWLQEAKSKSGSPENITVTSVTAKSSLLVDQYDSLIASANNIKNYCPCNSNCSGGCKNTCTRNCASRCGGKSSTSGAKSGY